MKLGAAFVQTVRHFFPTLNEELQALPDRRLQPACTYETRFLAWWGLLLFILKLGSRRQLNYRLDALGASVLANVNRLANTHQTTRPVHVTPWQLFGSLKNIAQDLTESIRCFDWPPECFDPEAAARHRISFTLFNTS